jgi:hypothetical protein
MTVAEKLELLTANAAAWRRLHAVQHEWVESLVGWSAPLAVSGNIFVFSRKCNDTSSEHEAVFPAVPVEAHLDLLVVRVPSPHRRIEGAQWMLSLPEGADELCIDAAQDLLIYLRCVVLSWLSSVSFLLFTSYLGRDRDTLFVRTLSTGVVHPSAIGHSGCMKFISNTLVGLFSLRVCGDYIAAGTRRSLIHVRNWKTGMQVSYQVREHMIRFGTSRCRG